MRSLSLWNFVMNGLLMGVNLFFLTKSLFGSEMEIPVGIITLERFVIELMVLASSVITVNGRLFILTVVPLYIFMSLKVSFLKWLFNFVLFPDEHVFRMNVFLVSVFVMSFVIFVMSFVIFVMSFVVFVMSFVVFVMCCLAHYFVIPAV